MEVSGVGWGGGGRGRGVRVGGELGVYDDLLQESIFRTGSSSGPGYQCSLAILEGLGWRRGRGR